MTGQRDTWARVVADATAAGAAVTVDARGGVTLRRSRRAVHRWPSGAVTRADVRLDLAAGLLRLRDVRALLDIAPASVSPTLPRVGGSGATNDPENDQ